MRGPGCGVARVRTAAPVLVALLAAAAVPGCSTAPDRGAPPAQEVVVLAAASLSDVMTDLEARFEAERPGSDVVLVLGPSSGLVRQVLAGSPGDVLVSAAPGPVEELVRAGEVVGDPVDVASTGPVLAVPAGNPAGVTGLADLAEDDLVVSLCEPQVPCGTVTAELLDAAGVRAAPDSLERDVRAVLTRLAQGEADAGVVYRTDALAAVGAVDVLDVPGAADVRTTYPAVALAGTTDADGARAFLDLLTGPAGRDALADAGFDLP